MLFRPVLDVACRGWPTGLPLEPGATCCSFPVQILASDACKKMRTEHEWLGGPCFPRVGVGGRNCFPCICDATNVRWELPNNAWTDGQGHGACKPFTRWRDCVTHLDTQVRRHRLVNSICASVWAVPSPRACARCAAWHEPGLGRVAALPRARSCGASGFLVYPAGGKQRRDAVWNQRVWAVLVRLGWTHVFCPRRDRCNRRLTPKFSRVRVGWRVVAKRLQALIFEHHVECASCLVHCRWYSVFLSLFLAQVLFFFHFSLVPCRFSVCSPSLTSSRLIVLSCPSWPCDNRMCFIAERGRPVMGSRMQRNVVEWIQILEGVVVPVNASSTCISTRVSRTASCKNQHSHPDFCESGNIYVTIQPHPLDLRKSNLEWRSGVIIIARMIHYMRLKRLVNELVCQSCRFPSFEALSIQPHPHSQPCFFCCELLFERITLHGIAGALSGSSFLSCVSQDIIIFVIICRHMVTFSHNLVRRPTSAFHCPTPFALHVESFWHCLAMLRSNVSQFVVACLLVTQSPTHVYPPGRQRPCVAAHDMEQPNGRIETVTQNPCRDAHLLPHLCACKEPFHRLWKIAASDIPNYAMRTLRLRRVDALTATAKTQVLHNETRTTTDLSKNLPEPGSPRGWRLRDRSWRRWRPSQEGWTLSLAAGAAGQTRAHPWRRRAHCRSRCGRGRPCTHPVRPVALSVNDATSVGHCGRTLCHNPSSRAISFPSLIRDAHLRSLSHSAAHPTLSVNLSASEKGQFLQLNHDVHSRLQGLFGEVRVCTLATWPGHARRQRWHVSPHLMLLHAPRFYPKKRCCRAPFVARPGRRAAGTRDAFPVPSPSLLCPPPLPSVGLYLLRKAGLRAKAS